MPSLILPCNCTTNGGGNPAAANFQNERYGAGMRVHNTLATSAKSAPKARCTVCSTERTV